MKLSGISVYWDTQQVCTDPGNSQGITAVNIHLTLNRAGAPSHIFSSTQDAFQLHLSVAQSVSWCAYFAWYKTEAASISSAWYPKKLSQVQLSLY